MQRTMYIRTSDLPAHIAAAIGSKQTIRVMLLEEGQTIYIGSQQWSEGSRDLYSVACLDGGEVKSVFDPRPWPQNMGELGETPLPPRHVIIKTGTFCGKPRTPVVYALATDISPQLAAPQHDLSLDERRVLAAICSLTSSGRKRFRDDFRMSRASWDGVVARLAELGLATPRGAATVEGRNACGTISDSQRLLNPYSQGVL